MLTRGDHELGITSRFRGPTSVRSTESRLDSNGTKLNQEHLAMSNLRSGFVLGYECLVTVLAHSPSRYNAK